MSQVAESFTLFPQLPPELRIKIWHHAIPNIRLISFVGRSQMSWPRTESITLIASKLIPTLLHVNIESREVGLEYYTLFRAKFPGSKWIYLNFNTDVFHATSLMALLVMRQTLGTALWDQGAELVRRVERMVVPNMVAGMDNPAMFDQLKALFPGITRVYSFEQIKDGTALLRLVNIQDLELQDERTIRKNVIEQKHFDFLTG